MKINIYQLETVQNKYILYLGGVLTHQNIYICLMIKDIFFQYCITGSMPGGVMHEV